MSIPTEPIGSIPRPTELIEATSAFERGALPAGEVERLRAAALLDTIRRFEATGSPVISDGEQTKPSFIAYPLSGVTNLAGDGVVIPFADGHTRQLPSLANGPFRYGTYADAYVTEARRHTALPVKQAVISASAMSLLYPAAGLPGYPREAFLEDVVHQAETDIRRSLAAGAHNVQIDFTEGRLALKLDSSGSLLRQFVELNNAVLARFDDAERARIGVHTCPGGDQDATHSADVDYAGLLPELFQLNAGRFYLQLASEPDRQRVLGLVRSHMRPNQMIFVGVTDPIDPRIETPVEIRDRVLEAATIIPLEQLGTTDDCGFSPFGDDVSTGRDTAFAKIAARVEGTMLAAQVLGI
jgi:5-methyltetrahydropteroyltriglutamate--homocysteine methyltransferase